MLIDSHAHLDFYNDPEAVITAARAKGVSLILAIGIGKGPDTMHQALDLAHRYPDVWATAGIHPQEASSATPEALDRLRFLTEDPRCIAIGEIGLDYYHLDNPDIEVQKAVLLAQIEIAASAGKPIILHCRTSDLASPAVKQRFGPADAANDMLTLLEKHWASTSLPGILHCFSGMPAHAARALKMGFYLSFAGNLTYPKSTIIQQVASEAPSDRILVETDSPFLSPVPHRGKENQPALLSHTAAFLAQLRHTTPEETARQTTLNFHTLFPMTA